MNGTQELAHDIRKLIADRIQTVPAADLFSIAQSICANDEGTPIHAVVRWTNLQPTDRFTRYDLRGDVVRSGGVAIHDAETDLTWSAAPLECGSLPWKEALKACTSFRLFGKDDWRAPTLKERISIVDYAKYGPALSPEFQAGDASYEWTSTPDAESPSDYAWVVALHGGHVYRGYQTNRSYVRAVRAGQPLSLGL